MTKHDFILLTGLLTLAALIIAMSPAPSATPQTGKRFYYQAYEHLDDNHRAYVVRDSASGDCLFVVETWANGSVSAVGRPITCF